MFPKLFRSVLHSRGPIYMYVYIQYNIKANACHITSDRKWESNRNPFMLVRTKGAPSGRGRRRSTNRVRWLYKEERRRKIDERERDGDNKPDLVWSLSGQAFGQTGEIKALTQGCFNVKVKVQVYNLISSLKTYRPTLPPGQWTCSFVCHFNFTDFILSCSRSGALYLSYTLPSLSYQVLIF